MSDIRKERVLLRSSLLNHAARTSFLSRCLRLGRISEPSAMRAATDFPSRPPCARRPISEPTAMRSTDFQPTAMRAATEFPSRAMRASTDFRANSHARGDRISEPAAMRAWRRRRSVRHKKRVLSVREQTTILGRSKCCYECPSHWRISEPSQMPIWLLARTRGGGSALFSARIAWL